MTMGNRPCGRNAIFKCVAIIATVVTTFSCVACGNAADSGSTADKSAAQSQGKHEKVKKSATQGLDGAHLRDNDSLYKVYDDSGVETMYLTVSRGNKSEGTDHSWSEINQYSVDDYAAMRTNRYQVNGLLQVGDEQGPVSGELGYGEKAPNATVQVRGQSSSLNKQKNYKIELKSGKGKWRGQRTIALNKHMGEGLRFRNKMAYDLIRGIDQMMGLRTQFVHLYVKDETSGSNSFDDYGLYTQVEQLNKTALKAHGLDKNGHLYKVNSFDFHRYEDTIKLADDPDYNQAKFEGMLEIKGDSDHTKLIEMLDELNDESQKIDDVLDTYFDTENLVYWLAFQILTGNCDTQNRNCYLYSPLNSNTWYFLDWDNDGMLRKLELSLTGFSDYASWERGASNYWRNVLFNRALRSKSFRSELDSAVKDLRSYLTEERLSKMVEHYREVTEPLVFAAPDLDNLPVTKDEYEQIAAAIPSEIEENYKSYRESYKKPMPFYIGVPQIDNGKLRVNWDAAYDFDARDIRYTVELARDYAISDVVFKAEDVLLPEVTCDAPDTGQYFVRVRATNSDGYTQDAFDYYVTDDGKQYGMKCFYVQDGGKVVEDTYEEG